MKPRYFKTHQAKYEAIAQTLSNTHIQYVLLNARQDADEADIIAKAGDSQQITVATNIVRGTDIKLTSKTKNVGSLHVILTEFHESARIDRQLFGRAGHQGDQGSCIAFISGEDPLMQQNIRLYVSLLNWIPILFIRHYILLLAIQHMQKKCQKRAYRNRIAMFKQDKKLNTQIGFAGKIY